jgi:FkbM family methyltransferase
VNYVYKLIERNNFENTVIIPVGISDKTEIGVLNFTDNSKANSSASMIAEFRKDLVVKRKEYIPLFNFEDLKDKINLESISVLKIDVEGAELEVLTSFKNELAKSETIILIEILPAYNEQNTFRIKRQNKIQELLFDLNYAIFKILKKKDLLLNFEEVKEIGIHSDLDLCDYVMVPKAKVDEFKEYSKQVLKN